MHDQRVLKFWIKFWKINGFLNFELSSDFSGFFSFQSFSVSYDDCTKTLKTETLKSALKHWKLKNPDKSEFKNSSHREFYLSDVRSVYFLIQKLSSERRSVLFWFWIKLRFFRVFQGFSVFRVLVLLKPWKLKTLEKSEFNKSS